MIPGIDWQLIAEIAIVTLCFNAVIITLIFWEENTK